MTAILESPWPILFCGILLEAALAVALVRTGRAVLFGAMAIVLVLTLAGVGLEWLIVTEVEEVEMVLDATAAALEANDQQAALALCSPTADHTRNAAQRAFSYAEFKRVKISKLKITINRHTSPPTAKARFTAMVAARLSKESFDGGRRLIGFTLTLRREPDGWRISDHELKNAPGGF